MNYCVYSPGIMRMINYVDLDIRFYKERRGTNLEAG